MFISYILFYFDFGHVAGKMNGSFHAVGVCLIFTYNIEGGAVIGAGPDDVLAKDPPPQIIDPTDALCAAIEDFLIIIVNLVQLCG